MIKILGVCSFFFLIYAKAALFGTPLDKPRVQKTLGFTTDAVTDITTTTVMVLRFERFGRTL